MKKFYSNGKLLITGEYVVLDGALALAIPTRFGQSLEVVASEREGILWKSLDDEGNCWYQGEFFQKNNELTSSLKDETTHTLLEILKQAQRINPQFLNRNQGIEVTTKLSFPRNWGLGTSSTLINNIASWAQINAFTLLKSSFGGSGYDLAAAQNNAPITFQLTREGEKIESTQLMWPFTNSLFFVHLNRKQDSKEGIKRFRDTSVDHAVISKISGISESLIRASKLSEFEQLLQEHERIISEIIGMPTIQSQLFKDYPNTVKSLGAWGGDFVLAVGSTDDHEYFRQKGYKTIVPFSEMIL